MRRTPFFCLAAAVLGGVVAADGAIAQTDPTPRSKVGGYSGQQLRQLYREDVGTGFTASSQNALALQGARATVPFVGQSTTSYGAQRLSLGLSSSRREKPFANVSTRPTVSPYLNLFREDLSDAGDLNYQTLVRPQIQQQQVNQEFQDASRALSYRVQQISARPAYHPGGSKSQAPTGHQTVFGYYGRFYPTMNSQGRR
jgi:hypothetical protein